MRKRPRKSQVLIEPDRPKFLVDLHAAIDAAVARDRSTIAVDHAYEGWEVKHEAVTGWHSRIAMVEEPERALEVWYDNQDHDVSVSGEVAYQVWTLEPGNETVQLLCLDEINRLIEGFGCSNAAPRT